MPGTLEYIESYFNQTLTNNERRAFEAQCENDETFAKEVAFYITTKQVLHEELLKQKTEQWQEENAAAEEVPIFSIVKKSLLNRWITYAAAACLVLAASVYLFETNASPKKLADNYIKANYSTLSQLMSGDSDSITLGMAAYNDQQYSRAIQLFEGVEKHDPSNSDVKKYAGLAYLKMQNYDKALQQFNELAAMEGLFSNSGDFLKAVTLMERSKPGDKEEAKKLLQKVVTEKEAENEKAEEWLKKL